MKKKNNNFRKLFLLTLGFLIIAFVAIQLYHPEITDTTAMAEFRAPPNVKSILKRACYDCHSNETDLRQEIMVDVGALRKPAYCG